MGYSIDWTECTKSKIRKQIGVLSRMSEGDNLQRPMTSTSRLKTFMLVKFTTDVQNARYNTMNLNFGQISQRTFVPLENWYLVLNIRLMKVYVFQAHIN